MNKLVIPKFVACICDQLNEGDEESPGMGPDHNQPLQQNSCYLFLNHFSISLCKQWQQSTAEVVSVAIRIAQLVGNGIEEEKATWK